MTQTLWCFFCIQKRTIKKDGKRKQAGLRPSPYKQTKRPALSDGAAIANVHETIPNKKLPQRLQDAAGAKSKKEKR